MSHSILQTPYFSQGLANFHSAHNDSIMQRMKQVLKKTMLENQKGLSDAIQNMDLNILHFIAHKIKGTFICLDLKVAYEHALMLELSAKDDDESRCLEIAPLFHQELKNFILALEQV